MKQTCVASAVTPFPTLISLIEEIPPVEVPRLTPKDQESISMGLEMASKWN